MIQIIKTSKRYQHYLWVLILLILGGVSLSVSAQTREESPWSTPLNLSNSGSGLAPTVVVDPSGRAHAFWQDPFSGFMYASGDGRSWSEPVLAQVPFVAPPTTGPGSDDDLFAGFTPTLLAGPDDVLHAFWTGEENVLYYSRATLPNVTTLEGWTDPQIVASSAVAFDARRGEDGRLHLAYVRSRGDDTAPAGIYYRQAADGVTWDQTVTQLYQSDYLRTIEAPNAHVQLAVEGPNVYAVWDNPALDTVHFARAIENGVEWQDPAVIDQRQPDDPPEAAGPAGIQITAVGNTVHLTWYATHRPESNCGLYHQWSDSNAVTWFPSSLAFSDRRGCPTLNQLWPGDDDLIFSLIEIDETLYLQAWDGAQWSNAVLQAPLSEFVHPQTFRPIMASCLHTAVTPSNQLLAVVCSASPTEDVWILERPLNGREEWSTQFQPTPVWSSPHSLATVETKLSALEMIADENGSWHAFWSQTGLTVDDAPLPPFGEPLGDGLYYSRLEGGLWSSSRDVLASPTGKTDRPAVTITDNQLLLVVWSGGVSGSIYFSRAPADEAVSITGWEPPQQLPVPEGSVGEWPDIAVTADGVIHVIYTVPFNEGRGVYLTRSTDEGASWSQPAQIFDGREADWSMVGQPRLAITGYEELHVVWSRRTTPENPNAIALAYANSADGGDNWSTPQTLVEAPIRWHDVVGIGQRTLHLLWWGEEEDRSNLWHQYSLDTGVSWSRTARISDPTVRGGPPALIQNMSREPYLLQLAESSTGQLLLQEWTWDGERWQHPRNAFLLSEQARDAHLLSAAVAPDGLLGAIYTAEVPVQTGGIEEQRQQIAYTQRQLPIPEITPTSLPTLTPTPLPTPAPTETPVPSPTPAPIFSPDESGNAGISIGPLSTNDMVGSIILSTIPAIFLVGLVFAVGLYLRKR